VYLEADDLIVTSLQTISQPGKRIVLWCTSRRMIWLLQGKLESIDSIGHYCQTTSHKRPLLTNDFPINSCCTLSFTCKGCRILHTRDTHSRSVVRAGCMIRSAHLAGGPFWGRDSLQQSNYFQFLHRGYEDLFRWPRVIIRKIFIKMKREDRLEMTFDDKRDYLNFPILNFHSYVHVPIFQQHLHVEKMWYRIACVSFLDFLKRGTDGYF
jgi:hypothetical protein